MWQDYAITATVLIFNLTTIPMIMRNVKLPPWTSIPMFLGACVLVATYCTLALWWSMAIEVTAIFAWSILLRRSLR